MKLFIVVLYFLLCDCLVLNRTIVAEILSFIRICTLSTLLMCMLLNLFYLLLIVV